jgi:capsular polysaccharide biosynthesis protein
MELRDYWQIIWRWRHLIGPLVAVTFIASLVFQLVLPPVYRTDTTVHVLAVIPPRLPGAAEYYSPEYYRTIHSEYVADDLSVIVKSTDFAEKVAARIRARYGDEVDAKDVRDAIAATKKLHRTLKITIATGSEARTRMIADAADDVLRTQAGQAYFALNDSQPVQINVIDPPRKPMAPGMLRRLLEVLLHSAVALVVGVGLAFLLHYLDDRIRDADDAARTLGWPVLGAVPVDDLNGRAPSPGPVPALVGLLPPGLLPRGWRKTPAA